MTPEFTSVPTKDDWGDIDRYDLDASHAYKRFFGKSLDEVLCYFKDPVLPVIEDLRYLPPVAFRYYVFALTQFLWAEKARTSEGSEFCEFADGAYAFLQLVRDKLKDSPHEIIPIMSEIIPAIEFIASHQELYDADVDIYGSFPERLHEINQLWGCAKLEV